MEHRRLGMMPTWNEGDIDADGVRIHFTRTGHGDKPALILAHGFSDNGLCWSRTASALEDDLDVVMLDTRNHGKSGSAPGDPALLVADIGAVVAGLGLDRPSAMGHSIGARTMAEFAAAHPDLVDRLVLEDPPWRIDPTPETDRSARLDGARAWVRSLGEMTESELEELAKSQHPEWSGEEYPAWIESKRQLREAAVDSLSTGDWRETVPRLACPTLLIAGEPERGGIVTPTIARRVTDMNAAITSEMIADAGHNIRRENFDDFIAVVRAFLLSSSDPGHDPAGG